MGKLSWQNWRDRMERLIKEQGSRLEVLEATVKEQKARLDNLEPPLHPPRQLKNISEIRDAVVRVLRIPTKVPKSTSSPGNEELADPPPADLHENNDATTEELSVPKRSNVTRTERLRAETLKRDTTRGNPKSAVKRSFKVDHRRSIKSRASATKIKSSSAAVRNALANLDSGSQTKNNSGGKRFKCTICAKTFPDKCSLNVHMRVHTGEKPFLCKVCRRRFTQGGNLKMHMRTHTQEKPFVCEFCRKAFSNGSHLTEHRRIHTGQRPFRCNFCNAAFSRSSNLTAHIRVHTKERPCVCEECGASFKWLNQLIRHKKMHAPANFSLA